MKKSFVALALILCSIAFGITIDGKLDDAEWSSAKEYSDFKKLASAKDKTVHASTSFKLITQPDRLFIGVKCEEPLMDKLQETPYIKNGGIWESDAIEIFLAPSGNANEFYQFLVCFCGKTATNYWAESGNIRPDPYMPEWKSAVFAGKDFWSIEVEIPMSAFYMTRQHLWNKEWAFNIGRKRNQQPSERTTWSPMISGYFEPKRFGKIGGFPMRDAQDDVYVPIAKANITSIDNGKPKGELAINVNLSSNNEYEFEGKRFPLHAGVNSISVPYTFEKEGRNEVEIALKRTKDGRIFKRWYPVNVKFEPIKIALDWPQYRNNFYPGQDHSHITGKVSCNMNAPVTLSIEGPGIKPQKITVKKNPGEFTFKTPGFEIGDAIIKAETKGASCELKVRNLPPIDTMMAWVENGNLVVMNPGEKKGTAILPRRMYATYYLGGDAFRKRFDADKDMHILSTPGSSPTIEPIRLVKGIEENYGIYDVKPPQELFDKLDEIIEKNKTRNFSHYYLSDEPECRNISPIFKKYVYDYVAEKDPYHLMMMASRACAQYIDCCDWFETHPYIDPMEESGRRFYGREFKDLGNYLDEISLSGRKDKVIGFMPSIFSYRFGNILSQYPTFEEIVCHTWAAMCHGGKSIWPYAYMDMGDRAALYEGTRYIFSTFDALQDFMLFAERKVLFRSDNYEVVHYTLGKEQMFVAVNFTTEEQKVDIKEGAAKYMEFRGSRNFKKIAFTLKPHEVIVGTTVKKDAGLPTYAETQAKIDKLEEERLNSPSQLVKRNMDIEVSASKAMKFPYKLFDGVRDVFAHSDSWGDCRYVEFSFTKFVAKFSRIGIYGRNIDKAIVKIRKGGEWQTITPTKTEKGEFSLIYDYDQTYTTVKMRFEFPMNHIELYEIEVIPPEGEKLDSGEATADTQKETKLDAVWVLDGKNTTTQKTYSSKNWFGEKLEVEPAEDGGFKMRGPNGIPGMHVLNFRPGHWVQFELVQAKRLPKAVYFNWSMYVFKGAGRIAGDVNTFPEGLYTINLPEVTKTSDEAATFYNYGLELHFKYIALVKEPENYICATVEDNKPVIEPGTTMTITLKLKEPCEDVTCKLLCDLGRGLNPFPINGTDNIELKPVNGDYSHWQAVVKVNSYRNGFKSIDKRNVMIKAVTLGSKLDTPIYTFIPASFKTIVQ